MSWFATREGIAENTTWFDEVLGRVDAPPGRSSALALIAANVMVGLLAAVFGWNCAEMLLVFWLEGLVIGGFHAMKLFVVMLLSEEPFGRDLDRWVGFKSIFSRIFYAFVGVNAFIVSFAVVAVIAYVITFGLIGGQTGLKGKAISESGIVVALVMLVASHGYSFACHFCKGGEYKRTSIGEVFIGPYVRLWLVALVLGVGLLLTTLLPWLGKATIFTVVIIGAKTVVDLFSHRREHDSIQKHRESDRDDSSPGPVPPAFPKKTLPPPLPRNKTVTIPAPKTIAGRTGSPFRLRVALPLSIPSFLVLLVAGLAFAMKNAGSRKFEQPMETSSGVLILAWALVAIVTLVTGTSAVVYSFRRSGPGLTRVLFGSFNAIGILAAILGLVPLGFLFYLVFILGGGPG
jgi:hypothetical protein